MRILLYEKPWHSHIDPHTAVSKVNAATLSVKDQRELQEFQDEQRNIQLQMADEALNQWKMWCSSHSDQLDTSLSLKKLIDFIDSKVIPQENALLRQLAHDNHIPISGVESLLLPLLRHLCQQEENELVKKAPRSSHQQSPLMVSIRMGPQLSPHLPLSKLHSIPPLSRSSRSGRSEYVTIVEQPFTHVDSETEEEEEEVSPWMSVRPIRDRSPEGASSPSAVLDDVSCLENSLEIVSTMSAEVESLCKAAHMSTIDFLKSSPYLLTDSFFTRLQKDQAKAERLGLNGTLYNSLLVEVLKEHVQLIQTLSIYMSNRVISLVPTSLTKNPTISKGLAALTSSASNTSPQTPSSINMSSPIGPKRTLKGRSPETMDQDVVQSDAPFIRIDQDQDAKVKEQIRMGYQDMVVQATGPSTPLSDKSKADENSVWLAWHRWKVGDDGSMSLEELVKCKGLDKLPSDLQNYAQKV
ncbi:hypothetical protein BGZ97_004160 [Linnemannia gamsii]|uniref:Uncharacterized protein n=1 Tax=Linnemannia gamsii TaxID=64522 RepID=A0A9P6UH83_9FUNG|nr:hypothetical protein BGZ97_004160 [Linnemannia gamsii]